MALFSINGVGALTVCAVEWHSMCSRSLVPRLPPPTGNKLHLLRVAKCVGTHVVWPIIANYLKIVSIRALHVYRGIGSAVRLLNLNTAIHCKYEDK